MLEQGKRYHPKTSLPFVVFLLEHQETGYQDANFQTVLFFSTVTSYSSWNSLQIQVEVAAAGSGDNVMLGGPAHSGQGCEPHVLSPLLGPFHHLKPFSKIKKKKR